MVQSKNIPNLLNTDFCFCFLSNMGPFAVAVYVGQELTDISVAGYIWIYMTHQPIMIIRDSLHSHTNFVVVVENNNNHFLEQSVLVETHWLPCPGCLTLCSITCTS